MANAARSSTPFLRRPALLSGPPALAALELSSSIYRQYRRGSVVAPEMMWMVAAALEGLHLTRPLTAANLNSNMLLKPGL